MAQQAQTAQPGDDRAEKLWQMIKDVDVAMMTTHDGGHLRSRPMWTLQQGGFDGRLHFFTRASSAKAGEVGRDHEVALSYADPTSQSYVSVSGTASVGRDAALIRRLWAEPMRTWFPQGPDDPDLALLTVEVDAAEYWDSPSSTMVHLYGYAKAALTGRSPHPGDTAKLDFQGGDTPAGGRPA